MFSGPGDVFVSVVGDAASDFDGVAIGVCLSSLYLEHPPISSAAPTNHTSVFPGIDEG
jgi:hypothetical protein